MRIVIAPDSFKGALTATEVCRAVEQGLRDVLGASAEILSVPLADGGEGTVKALVDATGGRTVARRVMGPLGDPVEAFYGLLGDGRSVAIEMAAASGLPLVPPDRRDPTRTTTYGTGELVSAALDEGVTDLIIAIGGSATNDAGAGMAQALGFRLLDASGEDLPLGGAALARLERIDVPPSLRQRLSGVRVRVACDVDNPLCGPNGASHVYGPQKGATPDQVRELDAALERFACVVARDLGVAVRDVPGSGAAGGLGAGLLAFLHGELVPGVDVVVDAVGLVAKLEGASLCITGEGQLDLQTLRGKTPMGALRAAKAHSVPVVALGGAVLREARGALEACFDAVFSISQGPWGLDDALAAAYGDLRATARQLARLLDRVEDWPREAHVSHPSGQG